MSIEVRPSIPAQVPSPPAEGWDAHYFSRGLNFLGASETPGVQLSGLDFYNRYGGEGRAQYDFLTDFVEDKSSTASVIVRAAALDEAFSMLWSRTDGYKAGEKEARLRERLKAVLPEYANGYITHAMRVPVPGRLGPLQDAYYYYNSAGVICGPIAREEGIFRRIYPDHYADSFDPSDMPDNVPIAATIAVIKLMEAAGVHAGQVPYEVRKEVLLRTTMLLPAVVRGEKDWPDIEKAVEYLKLSRFASEHPQRGVSQAFLYGLEKPDTDEFVAVHNLLYDAVPGIQEAFPEPFRDGVVAGLRSMIFSGIFGLAAHLRRGGLTDQEVQFLRRGSTHIRMRGREPLEHLRHFQELLTRAAGRLTAEGLVVVDAVDRNEFSIFDFQNPTGTDTLQVALNVRPRGGFTCDRRYEYGSKKHGTEARIDLVLDDGVIDPYRPYHRASQSPGAVSIRLDREGRPPEDWRASRDPTAEVGTIALDTGSLLSSIGLGRCLGEWFAFGNLSEGGHNLNHHTASFDQSLGRAAAFAEVAEEWRQELRRRARSNRPW